MPDDWQQGGFGLYVHWPFCAAKCPYCDFNSHVVTQVDTDAWRAAFVSEIERAAAETPDRLLRSIYFGGGTPSLMPPDVVGPVIDTATALWTPANDIEITLEANPSSVEAGRFRGYREAGVNRVSLGVQALNDTDLRRLGRLHDVAAARKALEVARDTFERTSFDLIYARQDQSLPEWEAELGEALSWSPDHLSLYQLTIEPGTAFGDRFARGGLRGLPDEDLAADMYFATQDLCEAHGLPAYEVSNHSRPGAESRHNLIYWNGGDYVGIGPGAHGRVTLDGVRHATWTVDAPSTWLKGAQSGAGEAGRTPLSAAEQAGEYLMMGLRTSGGLDLDRLTRIAGTPLPVEKIVYLADLGLIHVDDGMLKATREGRAVLNAVISELLPD
ncbi:MAG: radical SAM family heme chaperone HemW [Maritimibacter harenae]